ncbi:MAG: DUF2029 domain-containing protein [Cytophagales bacterium]|nr:DUF2029 domain-containing protein [Cytophagales bacterium]
MKILIKRLWPVLRFGYGVPALAVLVFLGIKAFHGGDFDVYLHAAGKLARGENIYQPPFLKGLPYIYSTFFALLLVPFSYLPRGVPNYAWLLANLFFLYRIWRVVTYYLGAQGLTPRHYRVLGIASFALTFRFLLYNFNMVQLTIFLLYASLEAVYLIDRNRKVAGALLLGVAMNIKILPLVMLPYLVYRRHFGPALLSLAVFALLLGVPALFIGVDFNAVLLRDWWAAINPASAARTAGEVENGPHGLPALIPTLFMRTTGNLPYHRHLLDLPYEQVFLILNAVRLLLISLTLYFLRTWPFRPSPSRPHTLYEVSYLLLVTPLLAPQQQKYAFFYLFPAVAYLVYFLLAYREGRTTGFGASRYKGVLVLLAGYFLLTTGTSDMFIGRPWNEVTQYYRLITYGTLLLIVPLALCRPAYLVPAVAAPVPESTGKGMHA